MKRRDFIKGAATATLSSIIGCSQTRKTTPYTGPGFDIHPFIKAHPEAVFIHLTGIESKHDTQGIHDTAYSLARKLFVPTQSGGYPNTTTIICKPNWTCNPPVNGMSAFEQLGINTDKNFVEGFLKAVRDAGPQSIAIRECACPDKWEIHGWPQMAKRNSFDLRDLTTKDFWQLKEGRDISFVTVPDGIVFKEIGYMAPVNDPDTYLVNIAKFKAHGMCITGSIKNLQGLCAKKFHEFCGGSRNIFTYYNKRYHKYFHADYMERVRELREKHVKDGIPRWDKPDDSGGFYMEQWVQRMLDWLSVLRTGVNMVEGIYGRDGDGFTGGPHDGKAQDYMSNMVMFGLDPFRVDIITHWLGGHEPGNIGLFHIGIERGMSTVLDPFDIPVYLWDGGDIILTRLDSFKRTPLVTYYLTKNYNGQNEPQFHLCNEPFDYTSWKTKNLQAQVKPTLSILGKDAHGAVIADMTLPEHGDVLVSLSDPHGLTLWRKAFRHCEPGVHPIIVRDVSLPEYSMVTATGTGWKISRQVTVVS